MTCRHCRYEWCWICGGRWHDTEYHKGTLIRFWHCGSITHPPDTCKRKFKQYMQIIGLVIAMPFILIISLGMRAVEYIRLENMYPYPPYGNCCKQLILYILYLPWVIFVTLLIILTILIAGIPSMIVTLLPAWFYNVRRFRRTQLYWKGKSKQKQIYIPGPVYQPPPIIEPRFPIRRPYLDLLDEEEELNRFYRESIYEVEDLG